MMTIATKFIEKLQQATGKEPLPKKFWEDYSRGAGIPSFQEVLDKYKEYYKNLPTEPDDERKAISTVFWDQVKTIGTPIIEDSLDSELECEVYFLLPKDQLKESEEFKEKSPGTKKDLYLQGDIHGYDSTDGRQRVKELPGTGIMMHRNTMPKDAIATYRYIELEPSLRYRTPTQHHGSEVVEEPPVEFFPRGTFETPRVIHSQTANASNTFWKENQLVDKYSTHRPPLIGVDNPELIFRVSTDPVHAHLPGEAFNWPSKLTAPEPSDPEKSFVYHDTLYSNQKGDLEHCATPMTSTRDLSLNEGPFSNFTRAIHVFKPASGQIDNVVIVNDGIGYLTSGMMDQCEKMVIEGNLSPNTAFVFVTPLPGLLKTLSVNDPKINMPGMGPRTIDYEHGIDNYIKFIDKNLLRQLDAPGFRLPQKASSRLMLGSSQSGTAGIYVGVKRPDLIGGIIAQSPSPSNRWILNDMVAHYDPSIPRADINLSSGKFERPGYADNTNFPYAQELSRKLVVPLQEGDHGHQFLAWTEELEQYLPATLMRIEHASLEVAREVTQQYRSALEEVKTSGAAAIEGDVLVEHKASYPFQITPKPSGDK